VAGIPDQPIQLSMKPSIPPVANFATSWKNRNGARNREFLVVAVVQYAKEAHRVHCRDNEKHRSSGETISGQSTGSRVDLRGVKLNIRQRGLPLFAGKSRSVNAVIEFSRR
jgi:hypothetical protein